MFFRLVRFAYVIIIIDIIIFKQIAVNLPGKDINDAVDGFGLVLLYFKLELQIGASFIEPFLL